jgi:hypothetical protein
MGCTYFTLVPTLVDEFLRNYESNIAVHDFELAAGG